MFRWSVYSSAGYRRGKLGGQSKDRGEPYGPAGMSSVWQPGARGHVAQELWATDTGWRGVYHDERRGTSPRDHQSKTVRHRQIYVCRRERGRTTPTKLWPWSTRFDHLYLHVIARWPWPWCSRFENLHLKVLGLMTLTSMFYLMTLAFHVLGLVTWPWCSSLITLTLKVWWSSQPRMQLYV